MRRINTLADLKAEQKLLLIRKTQLEAEIKKDYEEIQEDLKPLIILSKGVKGILTSDDNNILGNSVGSAAGFIAKNLFVRNSGFLMKLIVPFLIKNATSNVVENNKSKLADWVGELISKFTNKKTADENP